MNFFSLWSETGSTLEKVVISLAIGFCVAMFVMVADRRDKAKLVRELIKRGANSPDSALTLSELGVAVHGIGLVGLRNGESLLRRSVRAAPEKEGDDPGRTLKGREVTAARFYLPEEERINAEVRFSAKNTTLLIAILGIIAVGIVAYLCIRYIPKLLEFRLFEE